MHKDNTPPEIHLSETRVGRIETIIVSPLDKILINTGTSGPDTLLCNNTVYFKGRFTDNYGLSSFRLKMMYDSISQPEPSADKAIFRIQKGWMIYDNSSTENIKETSITNLAAFSIPESVQDLSGNNLPVREGQYFLQVNVMDLAGNKDSVNIPVIVLYQKTIIDNRKQNK